MAEWGGQTKGPGQRKELSWDLSYHSVVLQLLLRIFRFHCPVAESETKKCYTYM